MLKMDKLIPGNVKVKPFLERMDLAYAAADLIISRAGAGTISELCAVGKPVILVPSPNVAEDHQTKNAQALAAKNAAVMISEADARDTMMYVALELLADEAKCASVSAEIQKMARLDADEVIAKEVLKLSKEMMNLDHIKRVYLLGIGGIGMSGLARYFKHLGCDVQGYDKTETELTR